MSKLSEKIATFETDNAIRGKGPLCVMLVLTHKAKEDAPPFSANVLERSGFQREQRPITVRELIACYNRIVSQRETDPSLRIVIA